MDWEGVEPSAGMTGADCPLCNRFLYEPYMSSVYGCVCSAFKYYNNEME